MFIWIVWMFGILTALGLVALISGAAVYALAPATAESSRRN